jgi:hypothetical protein
MFLYMRETWSLVVMEEQRLKASGKTARRMYEPKKEIVKRRFKKTA